jgi:hypothetical protein
MQLHCLVEPKLERESVVYNTFVMFKFDEGFLMFKFMEVKRMESGSSTDSGAKRIYRENRVPAVSNSVLI